MFELFYIISSALALGVYAYLYKRVMNQFGEIYIPKTEDSTNAVSAKVKVVSITMRIIPVLLCIVPVLNLFVIALGFIFLGFISRR